jgi:hypothetical protein
LRDSFTFVFNIHDFLLLFVAVEYRSTVENRFSPMKNCLMSFDIERAWASPQKAKVIRIDVL